MTVYGHFGTMAETVLKYTRDFCKISVYHTSGKFKPSAKLTERQILPVGGDTGGKFLGCKQSRWGGWGGWGWGGWRDDCLEDTICNKTNKELAFK